MSADMLIFWSIVATLGMAGSALFSGMETGLYSLNRIRLHLRAQTLRSAAIIERLLAHPNRVLGTLLVSNNISNYAASLAVAALLEAAGYHGWGQVAVNALILTPLLLIFGEILPKDLFHSHSDRLVYPLARPLAILQKILAPALWLIGGLSAVLKKLLGVDPGALGMTHPRRAMTHLIREGAGIGLISAYQSEMVERVLQARELKVKDVMVPWSQVTIVRPGQPPEAVWALADRLSFGRLPLQEADQPPAGYLVINEVLGHDAAQCPPLDRLAHPMPRLDPQQPITEALLKLQREKAPLAWVGAKGKKPLGLVSVKDLVEPLVGELETW